MKDIIEGIDSRIRNPFFGYFLFSATAFNWEELFFLVLDVSLVSQRIDYFHNGTSSITILVYPFLTASTYSAVYPWFNYLLMKITTKPSELKNLLQAESEHKLLKKRQELERLRTKALENTEIELIKRAQRDASLDEIEDKESRSILRREIENLRKEKDNLGSSLLKNSSIEKVKLPKDGEHILEIITLNGGSSIEKIIKNKSRFDKIKTEYLIEELERKGYLNRTYVGTNRDISYKLTTNAKQLMVEKGIAT
tara:strand:+ start:113 stop:871 length:759 start_codon:yes stop_codon:yes gene_type:complete